MNFIKIYAGRSVADIPKHMGASSTISKDKGPIEEAIHCVLTERFQPIHLEVVNESYMHNVPKGSETHFKVLVVSDTFENLPLIKRHRLVNTAIKEKLSGNFVHALAIEAKTVEQWNPDKKIEPSPNCRGGLVNRQTKHYTQSSRFRISTFIFDLFM